MLIGYVAPEPGVRTPAVADIRAHLHTRLPDWMVPTHVVLLESLPRNERGKVDRRALPAPTRGPIEAPAPGVESEIAAEWARVLRLDEVGRNENLYALGGDSLSALQLVTTLGRRYCVDLTPSDLAAAPTVALLAEVVEARRDGLTPARQTRLAPTTVVLRAPTARSRNILFCFAGAGASALSFAPLAERAADTTAVVAFQPQGLANRAIPDWSVDRAAARHLKDLLAVQPTGPYWLAGHSLGAFIAIEVANHLRARGHDVELVTMLDPILPPKTVRAARVTLPGHARPCSIRRPRPAVRCGSVASACRWPDSSTAAHARRKRPCARSACAWPICTGPGPTPARHCWCSAASTSTTNASGRNYCPAR